MSAIWKYQLDVARVQNVEMPKGAKIVHVEAQFEKPCIWAIVDPGAQTELRKIGVLTTGESFYDGDVEYRGTFTLHGGAFVGHVVEPRSPDSRASK